MWNRNSRKGFDAPDRLFINIDKTYSNCFTEKGDLRELIPQFFYLPEMFININNLEFGNLQKPINFQNNTYDIDIPDLVRFTNLAKKKKVRLGYHKDIRDLIKDDSLNMFIHILY